MGLKKGETDRYLCIHGHFYQPPRENPWLEFIQYQESARPYHDWNERITRECYGPNTRGRLHGKEGRILDLINNYEYMSFNFGPTLLSWLEDSHPWIYSQILDADRAGAARYQGHGNAIAQVYNHIIMPLASSRDKLTQIRWGLADFRHRFGREAEGMWLAETAVDMETLDLMSREGVKFTILSPTQARSVRPMARATKSAPGAGPSKTDSPDYWQDVSEGRIDPTRPYRVLLNDRGDRYIDVFFYDGPLSRAIAYEKILGSAADLLDRIENIFEGHQDGPCLVNVATDGESYGHHFKFGEMALTWLFDHVEKKNHIKLINYGLFLELFPPEKEVKLFENSSWSCAHGVERWRSDCGCSVGRNPEWNQAWRTPLREGMDWLSAQLSSLFQDRAAGILRDPWQARDDYINVLLQDSEDEKEAFLKRQCLRRLKGDERVEIFKLLESQRMSLYMFTSCGWFFDDISGLEARQVLMYAARAMALVKEFATGDLEAGLMEYLTRALSNDPDFGNGGKIYQDLVVPSAIGPDLAAAHYAIISLIQDEEHGDYPLPAMALPLRERRFREKGIFANLGEVKVVEKRTGKKSIKTYMAVRRDGTELGCLVGEGLSRDLDQVADEIQAGVGKSPHEDLVDLFSRYAPQFQRFSLKDLIPDGRKYIIGSLAEALNRLIIKDSIEAHEAAIQEAVNLIEETGETATDPLKNIFRLMFFDKLRDITSSEDEASEMDWDGLRRLSSLCETVYCEDPYRDSKGQDFLRRQINYFALFREGIHLKNIISFLDLTRKLKIEPDLWECQNLYYDLLKDRKFKKSLSPETLTLFKKSRLVLGFTAGED